MKLKVCLKRGDTFYGNTVMGVAVNDHRTSIIFHRGGTVGIKIKGSGFSIDRTGWLVMYKEYHLSSDWIVKNPVLYWGDIMPSYLYDLTNRMAKIIHEHSNKL